MGFLTGARLGELGQLWVSDIEREKDAWYLNINDEGDEGNPKHLKNAASKRRIPPLANIAVGYFKSSAMLSLLSVGELMTVAILREQSATMKNGR